MKKVINFNKLNNPMLAISIILILGMAAFTIFVNKGFNFGIDFKPGMIVQVDVKDSSADMKSVNEALKSLDVQVQNVGDDTSQMYNIRLSEDPDNSNFREEAENGIVSLLESAFGSGKVEILSTEFVGARMAGSISKGTIIFTSIAMLLILIYIWIRFKLNYAVSAIVAILHDVLFLIFFIGVFKLEISTATIAALLTIIGYSLNDTIVIFDRIRENFNIVKEKGFDDIVNISISQSLSRTLITSLTTLVAVTSIYIFGTGSIKVFALNLIVGIIVGTYSSIFIASNVLGRWHNVQLKKVHSKLGKAAPSASGETVAFTKAKKNIEPPAKQTAEEIAKATEEKRKAKAKKKKKKR